MLDTNIIIGFLKNDSEIVNFISKQDVINVSVITIGEMYYGANISSSSKKNRIIYEDFFSYCNILNITENTAKHYSDIKAKLKISGKPIPENDVWIAANAL